MKNSRTAQDLQVGDTFRKQGFKFTVCKITKEEYKNGSKSLMVQCSMNNSKIEDSVFHLKPSTKI